MNATDRAQAFRKIRKAIGLNQTEMGAEMGVDRRTITRLERSCPLLHYLAAQHLLAQSLEELR